MDFNDFEPTLAIRKMEQLDQNDEGEDADDPEERPFVDENPCLLCGHKAFANFIDLTLVTSCTSQSSTPVKKKLRDILKRVWIHTKENNILCLACYDLVDRYDSLEAQLNNIRENIEEKYSKTCAKKHLKTKNQNKKRGRPKRDSKTPAKKQRVQPKLEVNEENNGEQSEYDNDDRGGADSDYSVGENDIVSVQVLEVTQREDVTLQTAPLPQAIPVEVTEEEPNMNVYDENHQMLQRGQKMRLGKLLKDENNMDIYQCGYCPHQWADIAQLHDHVHSYHMPEVVDVAIPPELGLGNTMNCGIEVQNCAVPPECPKPWACIYCDAVFRARTNMSSHFKDKHTPHKPFVCVDCSEAFRKGIDLNRHKLYFCTERTVTFAPKRKYRKREQKEPKQQKAKQSLGENKLD